MKSIFILAASVVIGCGAAVAQYMPTTDGKTYVLVEKETEGNTQSDITAKVISLQTDADGVVSARLEEKQSVPGELFNSEITTYVNYSYNPADKVTTYTMMNAEDFKQFTVDMLVQAAASSGHSPSAEDLAELDKAMKVRGELAIAIPDDPTEGATFEKSVLRCSVGTQTMTMTINKGVFKGTEEIETPAGKFNCIKVEYTLKRAMGGPVENNIVTAWFAKEIGLVKEVAADKKGKVATETVMKSISE